MSILIKGMKMPEDDNIVISIRPNGDVYTLDTDKDIFFISEAEACKVPTPHGRLIDENDVINAIHKRMEELQENPVFKRKHGDVDLLGVKPYITEIPTVIEAENEKDS